MLRGGGDGGEGLLSSPGGTAVPVSGRLLREALPRGPWVPSQCSGLVPTRDLFILCGRSREGEQLGQRSNCVYACLPRLLPTPRTQLPGGFEEGHCGCQAGTFSKDRCGM